VRIRWISLFLNPLEGAADIQAGETCSRCIRWQSHKPSDGSKGQSATGQPVARLGQSVGECDRPRRHDAYDNGAYRSCDCKKENGVEAKDYASPSSRIAPPRFDVGPQLVEEAPRSKAVHVLHVPIEVADHVNRDASL
jgi:hypothetical protein